MKGTVVIAGALAQRPRVGGHTWVLLQYILGFQRLGWDVMFLDRLEPDMCVDAAGRCCAFDQSSNLGYFLNIMEGFGLNGSWALIYDQGERFIGLPRQQVVDRVENAACFLNINGYFTDEDMLNRAPRRVFLDIDPGVGHIWQASGLADLFQGHDDYVTIGENIGQPDCSIPTCGLPWITTCQPVVLDYWPPMTASHSNSFTSIGRWRSTFGSLEYKGQTYGQRVHEFRKFVQLPRLSRCDFQFALDIHTAEVKDLDLLTANGWSLVDPNVVAGDPWAYRSYIQSAKAEFMVAQGLYVQTNSGWFSDRSICYLASGKPVLAQDTGLKQLYPTGEGLITFTTPEEALAGIEEISCHYARHTQVARALAEEHFDSDKVLTRLMSKLGVA